MKKDSLRPPVIAITTIAGLVVVGMLVRGLVPELVRYMRIRRM